MTLHALLVVSLFLSTASPGPRANATGNLSVSAVVTSSVSVIFNADGTYSVVVANASADAETIATASTESSRKRKAPDLHKTKFMGGKHVSSR
jgi:hypothetical protein